MLRLDRRRVRLCDGVSRRSFLQIGGLAMGGLAMPQILQAQQRSGNSSQHKSVIMIFLGGGPPHQDMLELHPDAPSEIRGEFAPISTNVNGIQISELMPRVAGMMDKFAVIRSLVGAEGRHDSFECCTGRHFNGNQPQGGWPAMGSSLSKLFGPVDPAIPAYMDLSHKMAHNPWNIKGSGFLGTAHAPFRVNGESLQSMTLPDGTSGRLAGRKNLLARLDRFRRAADADLDAGLYDTFTEQALGVLSSSKLAEAMDLEREDPKVRARYGQDNPKVLGYALDQGYQAIMSRFLQARRLVEAGARCVTCSFAHFDWHGSNFAHARKVVPLLDQGIAALVEDIHDRGLEKDVTVIVWGEFGRTPKINKSAGRDHWPTVHAALLAGGGMRMGQTIGSTNRLAESAEDRPGHMQEVFATLYNNLGINVATATIPDHNGRPQYLLERQQPIRALV